MKNRLLSLLLAAVMVLTAMPAQAFMTEDIPVGESYFDFESSEYLTDETDGSLEIKVYRHGSTDGNVDVAIKAADFLSVYGEDYEILIDGKPMKAVDGTEIDPAEFVYEEDGGAVLPGQATATDGGTADLPMNTAKSDVGAGSALRDAQAAYLDLPEDTAKEDTENAATELMGELYGFINDSRGAKGTLHFKNGEQYRSITVNLLNNDEADGERMFLLGLLGTDDENTTVAANATTYVTIADDEDVEPALFTLETERTTLTEDEPTAQVTVRRYSGLQYFSTAYVSTVTETAEADAYESFSLKTVAFAPGQETATVEVTGLDFTKGGSFGLRLETEAQDETDVHYVSFTLSDEAARTARRNAARRAVSGEVFGQSVVGYGDSKNGFVDWDYFGGGLGLDFDVGGMIQAGVCTNPGGARDLHLWEPESGYIMWYTNQPLDMVGVKQIRFSLYVTGDGSSQETWVEMDCDQSKVGSTASFCCGGHFGWQEADIPNDQVRNLWNWGNSNGWHYFKFITTAHNKGNSDAWLDWVRFYYAKYEFDLLPPSVAMPGYLFDFTNMNGSQPNAVTIPRQTGGPRLYTPPALTMKTTDGKDIAGFYNNWSGRAILQPASALPNGIYLKGAYLYKDDPYDKQTNSFNSNAYYVTASSDGKIYLDLNRDLIRNLMQKGAIDSPTSDATIRVYPDYGESTATVSFPNFGSDGYNTAINNLAQYAGSGNKLSNCGITTDSDNKSYVLTVPTGSVLRLSMSPAADRTAAGYKYIENGRIVETWRKQGTTLVDGINVTLTDYTKADIPVNMPVTIYPATGAQDLFVGYFPNYPRPTRTVIDPKDSSKTTETYEGAVVRYTKDADDVGETADAVTLYMKDSDATIQYRYRFTTVWKYDWLYPALILTDSANKEIPLRKSIQTGTGFVGTWYTYDGYPDGNFVFNEDGTGSVYYNELSGSFTYDTREILVEGTLKTTIGTDKDGKMTIPSVRMGEQFILMASPPEGYFTHWTDMTGDFDGDGYITAAEKAQAGSRRRDDGERSDNPLYVFGDVISFPVDQDNTRYYYDFQQSVGSKQTVTGTLLRHSDTLYQLANNISNNKVDTPVAGAYVNIAGHTAQTDENGYFEVTLKGLPPSGEASATYSVGSSVYYSPIRLEAYKKAELPALEQFTAQPNGVTASYADGKNASGNQVTIVDGKLTLTAKIGYNSAIVPKAAHFTIVKPDGSIRHTCDGADGYTTSVSTPGSGVFQADLTFNPKQDMSDNDRVFVAFEDVSGYVYSPIDMGFVFYGALTLRDVVLPALGPAITGAYTNGFVSDLIGDPLGEIEMGTFSSLGQTTESYTPAGVSDEQKTQYTWNNNVFSWNFSKEFKPDFDKKKDDDKKKDEKTKEAGEKVAAASEADLKSKGETKKPDDGKTPTQSGSGYSTKGKFSFSITPTVGFQLTLSQRHEEDENGNTTTKVYFEDLILYVKCDIGMTSKNVIQTPIGISVLIDVNLSGDENAGGIITGIYRMYTDYQETYETEDAVPYDKTFSFFKTGNDARRHEGYIFLNPVISLKLGISVGVAELWGSATFAFDMDFHFTGTGNQSYGNLNISGKWGVKLLTFNVYSKDLGATNVKLFSHNADSGFDFNGIKKSQKLMRDASAAMEDVLSAKGETFAPTPIERSYLKDRSAWNGDAADTNGAKKAPRNSTALGSVEGVLRAGTGGNHQFRIVSFGDEGQALAVFVDDAPDRRDINSRAVYFTVRDKNGSWSEPQIIDDDGTMDDYPYAEDLGNGRILIAWSSADEILKDDATLEYALQCLAIEYAVFDTDTQTMGEGAYLTHATDLDICGDLRPRIAYDSASNKAILYYVKTEYKNLKEMADISEAYSAVAYLLYDPATQTWSNTPDAYTEEELARLNFKDEAEKAAYLNNWYGQRFLDLRLDDTAAELPLVIDADAVDFNGMGLFAYTVDWDKDQNTLNDRDVFLQAYDFAKDEFTHILRISPETGSYSDPELEESDNSAYLFYGVMNAETGESEIRALNIGDYLKDGYYNEVANGRNTYSVLLSVDGDPATAAVAAEGQNMLDYHALVTAEGRIYLLWTDTKDEDSGRDIYAVTWNNKDGEEDEATPTDAEEGSYNAWTKPVALTHSGKDTCYSGFGMMADGENIVILSDKGSFSDPNSHGVVQIVHKPFARVELDEALELSDDYAAEGDLLTVTATLKNVGLLQDQDGDTVTFYVNGEKAAEVAYDDYIPGGDKVQVSAAIVVPAGEVAVTAKCNNTEAGGKLRHGARLSAENEELGYLTNAEGTSTWDRAYSAMLFNNGNEATGEMTVKAKAGDTVLAVETLPSVAPKQFCEVSNLFIPFAEDLCELDETTGFATLDVTVTVTAGDEELYSYDATMERLYDVEAMNALKSYKGAGGLEFTMDVDDFELLKPTVVGENLKVEWMFSSNPEVAWIDHSGAVCAEGEGTTKLTGVIVPGWDTYELNSDGTSRQKELDEMVTGDLIRNVTAVVTVSANATPGDVDGDDMVTAADARLALRRSVNLESFSQGSREYVACDADKDKNVTAADARLILRASVKLENLSLFGTWKNDDVVYTFNTDCSGETADPTTGMSAPFEYDVNGDTLTIRANGPEDPETATFAFSDDMLTLTFADGKMAALKRAVETKAVVGTWKNDDVIYTFNADGSGEIEDPETGMASPFEYEVNGGTLMISTGGPESAEAVAFTLTDKTLVLAFEEGGSITLTRIA